MNNIHLIKLILSEKKQFAINLKGKSMEPTFYENDNIIIQEPRELHIGDVVLFHVGNELILHRVYLIHNDWLVTKGDNHELCDDIINRSQVLGKALINCSTKDMPYLYKTPYTFNIHDYTNTDRENWAGVLESSRVRITYDSIIEKESVNVGIIAMAKDTLDDIVCNFSGNERVILHFNIKVSNANRADYFSINDFDYLVRLGGRISHSLLSLDQQVIMALGILHGTGAIKNE